MSPPPPALRPPCATEDGLPPVTTTASETSVGAYQKAVFYWRSGLSCETASRMDSATPGSAALAAWRSGLTIKVLAP